jgi:SAM-dependent methyltransferase
MPKPSTYRSGFNADLLAFIPPDSRKVLEFGCGAGALATQFKRINPRCEIWGVEGHQESCDLARRESGVDWVFCGDAEKFDPVAESKTMSGHPEPIFSTAVFGDILEHLVDPHGLIKRCVEWLEPGGSIVACVPNAQHFSVIRTLLEGQWPLHDSGLFDADHLRWFTRDSLIEMFEGAGLSIARIAPRVFNTDGSGPLVEAVRKFGLVSNPSRFAKDCLAYQLVIQAFKGELPARRVLVRGFTAEACCARPRLTEPGSFIDTIPGFRYSEAPTEVEPGESVVVVRQRWNIDEGSVRKHLKDGCLVVGEWDDDPWHKGYRGTKLKVFDVEWALKACHAISVSTEAIAELVRPINPNVAVFPNQVVRRGDSAVGRQQVQSVQERYFNDRVRGGRRVLPALPRTTSVVLGFHSKERKNGPNLGRRLPHALRPLPKPRRVVQHVARRQGRVGSPVVREVAGIEGGGRMSEKLCGTCKWFDVSNPGNYDRMPNGRGRCTRFADRGTWDFSENETDLVYLCSYEEVVFACLPAFGCVLHEPRPPADRPADG